MHLTWGALFAIKRMLICRTITTKATEISPTDASARRIRGRLPSFKRAVSLL